MRFDVKTKALLTVIAASLSSILTGHASGQSAPDWGEIRYVHSPTNIRAARSARSQIVGKLDPGDRVKADLLRHNWYAVFEVAEATRTESRALGYVYAPLLKKTPPLAYKIMATEDVSYGRVRRYSLRVRVTVDRQPGEPELRTVSQRIIEEEKERRPHNALSLFFYLPDSDIGGAYTAGMAEWAPYGDWSRAGDVRTGDYSHHELKVTTGGASGIDPQKVKVHELSLATKKRMYYDLVAAQDRGVGDRAAYDLIAQQYGVGVKTVEKVATEGSVRGWPMP